MPNITPIIIAYGIPGITSILLLFIAIYIKNKKSNSEKINYKKSDDIAICELFDSISVSAPDVVLMGTHGAAFVSQSTMPTQYGDDKISLKSSLENSGEQLENIISSARGIKLSENSSKFIILKSDGSEIPIEIENSDSKKLFKKILTELENKIDKKTEQGNNM